MATISVIAGQITKTKWILAKSLFGHLYLGSGFQKLYLKKEVASIEAVTEENQKKFTGAAALGLAGGIVFGPLGLLAGVLAGGNRKEVCFVATLKDGRQFMATTDVKTYQKILAAIM